MIPSSDKIREWGNALRDLCHGLEDFECVTWTERYESFIFIPLNMRFCVSIRENGGLLTEVAIGRDGSPLSTSKPSRIWERFDEVVAVVVRAADRSKEIHAATQAHRLRSRQLTAELEVGEVLDREVFNR